MIKNYLLRITLKSDLCASSGYSYAGVIDTDVCYDECGLPYIPSRRIKGCLRECMGLLNYEDKLIKKIFGTGGQDGIEQRTSIRISDAYLQNYKRMQQTLHALMKNEKCSSFVTQQHILEQYTTIKAQTRLTEHGNADKNTLKNTLRFTRTVNHYDPEGKEIVFDAEVSVDEKYETELKRSAQALRHIGVNRNRGLGNVRCELVEQEAAAVTVKSLSTEVYDPKETCILKYTIKAEMPIVISKDNDSISATYINGQSVLGYFANAYIRSGKRADTEEFEHLFLENQVIFGALYPSKGKKVYHPAPAFVSRLKKTKKYVNNISSFNGFIEQEKEHDTLPVEKLKEKWKDYDPQNGNQPKKLSGKYMCLEMTKSGQPEIDVMEVETEIIYHHRKKSKEAEAQLYVLEAIKKDQEFTGEIRGTYEDLQKLISILQNGKIYLGKSKNAQYGKCSLVDAKMRKADAGHHVIPKGSYVIVALQSDGLFLNEYGYTIQTDQVRECIAKDLGIPYEESPYSEIEVSQITGYYGKWNLKRQSIPGVCAGSCFAFILSDDYTPKTNYVGVRNGEGYGKVNILDMNRVVWKLDGEESISSDQKMISITKQSTEDILLHKILHACVLEKLKLMGTIDDDKLTSSAVGRVTLMLTESMNHSAGNVDRCKEDFKDRCVAIKDDEKRKQILDFIELSEKNMEEISKDVEIIECCRVLSIDADEINQMIDTMWAEYMMYLFIELKYAKKGDTKE